MLKDKNETPTSRVKVFIMLGLALIILLGVFLRFYNLGATSVGNEYYAATVKSMMTSWHNFFFVSFEPGGSVSVDKPPLGFWLEAISAFFLGVNGFALAFPNALAGVLAIPLLYSMVKKQFGQLAGLTSALVLAVTPITIAAERNNTIDGILVFVLLMAAWAVWKSVESGKFRYLLLGMLLVGLGFNIKMLQAYMVLPALYALYLFGSKHSLGKRIFQLGLATVLLLVVSLSWAVIVDSVPAADRPFVGSSIDNSELELIFGHNGISRILGRAGPANNIGDGQTVVDRQTNYGLAGQKPEYGSVLPPRPGSVQPPLGGPEGNDNRPGGPNEVGVAGWQRLFTEPLSTQISWLMPLALLGLALTLAVLGRPWPLTEKHLAILLWAGWLLPMMLYFTFTAGLWHTYYLIMLGPGLAALVGMTVWALVQVIKQRIRFGWVLATLLTGVTLGFELFIISKYPLYFSAASTLMMLIWLAGVILLAVRLQTWALVLMLLSLLVGPFLWSGLTTFNPQPEVNLPKAGPSSGQQIRLSANAELNPSQQKLLDYLTANTAQDFYLAATLDSHSAAPFILATGRPVLTFGGFSGADNVIDLEGLQKMVNSGMLRFIIDNGNLFQKQEIFTWVKTNCKLISLPGMRSSVQHANQGPGNPHGQLFTSLYDCEL